MNIGAISISTLDPANIVDLDLGGEELRQGALRGICAGWALRPPFYVVNFGMPQVVVGRNADFRELVMDEDRFTTTPPAAPGYERFDFFNGIRPVSYMDGAAHERVRRLLMPSFGPASLVRMEASIQRIVAKMLDEVEAKGGAFDAMTDFSAHLIPRILLDGVLDFSPRQQHAFGALHQAFSLVVNLKPGEARPEAFLRAEKGVFDAIAEIVADRRQHPREDFVGTLVAAREAGDRLSDSELIANIYAICAAGLGTTANTTGAMLLLMCKHPAAFAALKADPSLIPDAVEESLRFHGAGFFGFPRFAKKDCELGGTRILAGMPVHASTQAANLDPKVFPDPLRFDIRRKGPAHVAFGTGAHLCIGNRVARTIIRTVLAQVVQRFPGLRLQNPDFEPHYVGMFGELTPASLPLRTGS